MNIERMEFIAWMERIMNRFDILSESIKEAKKDKTAIDGEELLDNGPQLIFMVFTISLS